MVSNEEIASLSEKSATLEILFQYMYPQRQPDLEVVEFEVLKDLAEAAEKYQVFPALEVCKSYMRCESERDGVISYQSNTACSDMQSLPTQ